MVVMIGNNKFYKFFVTCMYVFGMYVLLVFIYCLISKADYADKMYWRNAIRDALSFSIFYAMIRGSVSSFVLPSKKFQKQ